MSQVIDTDNLPKHIAITMDGNGRWAESQGKLRVFGHKNGVKAVRDVVESAAEIGIKYLTLYAFSTENWKRPRNEIKYLFSLLENFLINKINELNENNVRLRIIGNTNKLSKKLKELLKKSEKITKKNSVLQINLALSYGSKYEIVNAINLVNKKKLILNEKNISNNLYTYNCPDPDILIRTGNTHRLSNFLLWQAAYSEIFFEEKLWPDFTIRDYNNILNRFKKIKRNFGNV